ncbi:MAG: heavy metal transport/detoxification protein [Erysipelotrichaceae bacterium]|nr:MAG: heavy metal transport/detoxification [Erysipelotrichaceae bacterium]TXT16405.1 MAG: heavy metal transport/detoxification protein [Erysipelotrichaceae bacterium]
MKKTIFIEGMHCSHCAGLVNIELFGIKEVIDVKVSIGDKTAIVVLKSDVSNIVLTKAVEKAGYKVVNIN